MKLSEIEAVARVVKDGQDYGLIESEVIQGISMLPVGTKFYTAEQMQEYAKECVIDALNILDNTILPIFEDDKRVVMQKIFEEDTKNDK